MKRTVIPFFSGYTKCKNVHPAQLASRGNPSSLHQSHQPVRCDVFPFKVLIKNDVCFLWRLHQCSDGTCPLISLSKSPGRPPATSHFAVPRRAEKNGTRRLLNPSNSSAFRFLPQVPQHMILEALEVSFCACAGFFPHNFCQMSGLLSMAFRRWKPIIKWAFFRRPSKKRQYNLEVCPWCA